MMIILRLNEKKNTPINNNRMSKFDIFILNKNLPLNIIIAEFNWK